MKIKVAGNSVEEVRAVSNKNYTIKKGIEMKSKPKKRKDSVFKFRPEACKTVLDKGEPSKEEQSSKSCKCNICDYSCDKATTLKKHINTKHTNQKCDICRKEFKTSMEVLSHKAKEHQEEDEVWNVKVHSTPKKDHMESSLKFSETKGIQLEEKELSEKVPEEKDQLDELEAELSALKKELS